jgi:hypothetical protein
VNRFVDGMIAVFAITAFVIAGVVYQQFRFFARAHLGQFDELPSEPGRFRFRSDFGLFELDPHAGRVRIVGESGSRVRALDSVVAIGLHQEESLRPWWEDLLVGANVTDLLVAYRDRIVWHIVSFDFDDGTREPAFAVGEYERREFGTTWLIRWRVALLRRWGWQADVPRMAIHVRDALLSHLPRLAEARRQAVVVAEADRAWLLARRDD